jgi:hypothetical protein
MVDGGVSSVGSAGMGRATTAGSSAWTSSPYSSDRSIVLDTATVDVVMAVLVDAAVVVEANVGASEVPVVGTAIDVVGSVGSEASLLATEPLLPVQETSANASTTANPQIPMTHHGRGTARNRSPTVTHPTLTVGPHDLAYASSANVPISVRVTVFPSARCARRTGDVLNCSSERLAALSRNSQVARSCR